MRRKDREVTDEEKIKQIIKDCHCCRVGLYDGNSPYIVPFNFGYEEKENQKVFYFHGATVGKKITLIKNCNTVGFELDIFHGLRAASEACGYTCLYQSIVGSGTIHILDSVEEKLHGLQVIMEHYTGRKDWTIPPCAVDTVAVFRLNVKNLTCKEHV